MARTCKTCEQNPMLKTYGYSSLKACSDFEMRKALEQGDCNSYQYALSNYKKKEDEKKASRSSAKSSSGSPSGLLGLILLPFTIIKWLFKLLILVFKILLKWPFYSFPKFLWKKGIVGKIILGVYLIGWIVLIIVAHSGMY